MLSHTIKHINRKNLNEFIEITELYYANNDIVQATDPFVYEDHANKFQEAYLILNGKCYYKIYNETVECNVGDCITIKPGVIHSFEYKGGESLKVLRFSQER